MNAAPSQSPQLSRSYSGECRIESYHLHSGHVHFLLRKDSALTCFVERPGISRVTVLPPERHPASLVFHSLRFEALRVGGTMIIVRDNTEVLEEIYPENHHYLLIDGGYRKLPLTTDVRNQLINSIGHADCKSIDWLVQQLLQKHDKAAKII